MVHIKLYRSNSHNNCVTSMLKSFTIWSFFITQSHLVQSFKNFDLVEVAGSGESERTHQECYPEFQLFDQKYLRGVNKPFYTTKSNNVTLDRCMELCCNQPPEICRSFSYFLDLNVCYLMNVTQYDNFAILQPAVSFKHYHRSGPLLSSAQLETTEAHFTANQISNIKPNTNPVAGGAATANVTPNTASVPTRETPVTTLTRLLEPGKAPTSRPFKTPSSGGRGGKHDALRPEKTFNISNENEHQLLTSESGPIRPSTVPTTTTPSRVTSELSTVMSSTVFAPPATTATPAAVANNTSLASTVNVTSALPSALTKPASVQYDVVLCSNHYCQNGGTCVMQVDIKSNKKFTKCNCPHGYEGADCERNVAKKGSLPSYIIIVAILGSLFLLLFGAVLVLYVIYRRRTGKYRVKKRREDWRKTAASPDAKEGNPQQQDEEVHCVQEQGSTSGASTVGSVTSTATRSTNATL